MFKYLLVPFLFLMGCSTAKIVEAVRPGMTIQEFEKEVVNSGHGFFTKSPFCDRYLFIGDYWAKCNFGAYLFDANKLILSLPPMSEDKFDVYGILASSEDVSFKKVYVDVEVQSVQKRRELKIAKSALVPLLRSKGYEVVENAGEAEVVILLDIFRSSKEYINQRSSPVYFLNNGVQYGGQNSWTEYTTNYAGGLILSGYHMKKLQDGRPREIFRVNVMTPVFSKEKTHKFYMHLGFIAGKYIGQNNDLKKIFFYYDDPRISYLQNL